MEEEIEEDWKRKEVWKGLERFGRGRSVVTSLDSILSFAPSSPRLSISRTASSKASCRGDFMPCHHVPPILSCESVQSADHLQISVFRLVLLCVTCLILSPAFRPIRTASVGAFITSTICLNTTSLQVVNTSVLHNS